jgi:hypothetical protein
MPEKTYISPADTAKLVRKALKREFPGVKFSVRTSTYAGGASIDVSWTDGPTTKQVDPVIGAYEGADFDGMIDLKHYCETWLMADGSVAPAYSAGTEGSRGVDSGYAFAPPAPDAVLVSFGADFIHTNRHLSRELLERAIDETCAYWGIDDRPVIVAGHYGGLYLDNDKLVPNANEYSTNLVYKRAQETAAA